MISRNDDPPIVDEPEPDPIDETTAIFVTLNAADIASLKDEQVNEVLEELLARLSEAASEASSHDDVRHVVVHINP